MTNCKRNNLRISNVIKFFCWIQIYQELIFNWINSSCTKEDNVHFADWLAQWARSNRQNEAFRWLTNTRVSENRCNKHAPGTHDLSTRETRVSDSAIKKKAAPQRYRQAPCGWLYLQSLIQFRNFRNDLWHCDRYSSTACKYSSTGFNKLNCKIIKRIKKKIPNEIQLINWNDLWNCDRYSSTA